LIDGLRKLSVATKRDLDLKRVPPNKKGGVNFQALDEFKKRAASTWWSPISPTISMLRYRGLSAPADGLNGTFGTPHLHPRDRLG